MKLKLATQGITILVTKETPNEEDDYDDFCMRICFENVAKIIKI